MLENQVKSQSDDQGVNKMDYLYDTMYKLSSDDDLDKFNKFIVEHNLKDQIITENKCFRKI